MNVILGILIFIVMAALVLGLSMIPVYLVVLAINYICAAAKWSLVIPTDFWVIFCITFVLAFVVHILRRPGK